MPDILQIPAASGAVGTFNSGIPLADIIRGIPIGLIFLDAGTGFSQAERASQAAFLTALRTKARAPRGSRAFPFWELTNFEDKSKEPTKASTGNLTNGEITTADGIPSFAFQHRIGEIMHKAFMDAQAAGLEPMIVDHNYAVYGTIDGTIFKGYKLSEFYTEAAKFGNTSQASVYQFMLTLASQKQYKENGRFVQANAAITAITGIRDVVLEQFSLVGNVLKVKLTASGGKLLTDLFATELLQVGAWAVKDNTGAPVTITTAYDSVNKVISITLGTGWTGAATNTVFTADLTASSVLAGLSSAIDGYESTGPITFQKP